MYNEHFGLQQAPFRITPDTRLFYGGGGRGEILDALVYAIVSGEGIVKVVGEVGTGKTMLCRMLEERLPDHVEIVYLVNPSLKPNDILQAIGLEMNLDIPPGSNRLNLTHALQQRLLEKHASNLRVVVFVEEAQSMPIETLEEIRLLSNLETKREKLLQIVLFGQPELDENLNQPNIRQLKERITHSFYLEPLNRNELRDYVKFRMRAVGYKGPDVFRSNAYVSMTRASEGLTRRINILADKALLAAYANDRHEVRRKDVRKAINDSQFELHRRFAPHLALGLGIVLLAGAVGWRVLGPLDVVGGFSAQRGALSATELQSSRVDPEVSVNSSAAGTAQADSEGSKPARNKSEELQRGIPEPNLGLVSEPRDTVPQQRHVGSDPGPQIAKTASPGVALIAAAARAAMLSPEESLPVVAPGPETGLRSHPENRAEIDVAGMTAEDAPAGSGPSLRVSDSPPSDLIAARIAVTRQWLARANEDHYSIQLLLTTQGRRPHVEAFLERQDRMGEIDQVYVYETVIDDRPYLGVLYREFSGYRAAKRALENLPPHLKRLSPFIRNLRDVASVG